MIRIYYTNLAYFSADGKPPGSAAAHAAKTGA
jgi:hypothetical protein